MRIAITGTHSVGKTTLARAVSERLGLTMIREVARDVIKLAGYNTTAEYIQNADLFTKKKVQKNIYFAQLTDENTYRRDGFVSDRSIFDPVAYAAVYGITGEPLYKMIGSAITHALGMYDLLVYVPPMFSPVYDGFRDTSDDLRMAVDECLTKYIEAYETLGGTVLLIESETVEERIEEVLSAVKGYQLSLELDGEGPQGTNVARKSSTRSDMDEQTTIDLERGG